jgi:hypothetical protein
MPARILVALTAVLLLGALRLDAAPGAAGAGALNKTAAPAAMGCNAPAAGCCIALKFDPAHLPSQYGWRYENLGTRANQGSGPAWTTQGGWPEGEVFAVKNGHLVQSTVAFNEFQWGGFSYGGGALYVMPDVVSPTAPFTLTAKVNVTNYQVSTYENAPNPNTENTKGYQPGDPLACGFSFSAMIAPRVVKQPLDPNDQGEQYAVCIAPGFAQLQGGKLVALTANESGFHIYQLRVLPGAGAALYIDGELKDRVGVVPEVPVSTPKGWPPVLNGLTIGKGTGQANADAEIASFSYCTCEGVGTKQQ